ncbi:SDR family NAD(P)-dependent oxidoreductase [Kordiimonas sp.]|uniref:SDR family NAD(P)-dependent oxidoreductase n=1 Tax=Kordiimonas sp. TaxID=1970157 RepID=UPI003A94617F
MRSKQHTALVTGGGSGIGLAVAKMLSHEGFRVIIAGRSLDRLQQAVAKAPALHPLALDVSSEEDVSRAFDTLMESDMMPDVLINNAGAAATAPLERTSLKVWQSMLDVNLTGAFLCTRAVLPHMKSQQFGRIITVASTAALKGYAYTAAYTAAKHGILGMTRALALELAGTGVTANAVCPGFTDTDIVRTSVQNIVEKTGRSAKAALNELTHHNPENRLIRPEEVADTVLWLAGEKASAINGQAIAVACGEVM